MLQQNCGVQRAIDELGMPISSPTLRKWLVQSNFTHPQLESEKRGKYNRYKEQEREQIIKDVRDYRLENGGSLSEALSKLGVDVPLKTLWQWLRSS